MEDLVIIGAGGLAREAAFVVEDINKVEEQYKILGFVESDPAEVGRGPGLQTPIQLWSQACRANRCARR